MKSAEKIKTVIKKTGFLAVWLLVLCLLFAGCGGRTENTSASAASSVSVVILPTGTPEAAGAAEESSPQETAVSRETEATADAPEDGAEDTSGKEAEAPAEGTSAGSGENSSGEEASEELSEDANSAGAEVTEEELAVKEDGTYTSKEEVALYIHTYGKLPSNYITKKKAEQLGWDSSRGNLWDVAPGMSIGGGRFGNYEGILPDGDYRECDIGYEGGYRGAERIVYSDDGRIYYTGDHYNTFEQLY